MLVASKDAEGFFIYPNNHVRMNFHQSEFFCPCGRCDFSHAVDVADKLLMVLQDIRAHFGRVHVTSGARCADHNAEVGGAKKSQHLIVPGEPLQAADIFVPGATQMEIHGAFRNFSAFMDVQKLARIGGGFGIYRNGTVHIDVRSDRMEWVGPAGSYLSEPGPYAVEKWASRQLWKGIP